MKCTKCFGIVLIAAFCLKIPSCSGQLECSLDVNLRNTPFFCYDEGVDTCMRKERKKKASVVTHTHEEF